MAVSLALGLLVGMQRERTKPSIAGVRTFALITLFGTATAMLAEPLGGWVVAAGLLGIAALALIGKRPAAAEDSSKRRGITTEVATLIMYGVGVMCQTGPMEAAVVIGAVTALLLHAKPMLHGLALRLGDRDFRAIMQFVLLALVILPVLPDRTYGAAPFNVLNPRQVWLVVVLVVGINLTGFLACRFVGARGGILLSGVLGGLVSSTATTVSLARRARNSDTFTASAAAVIVLASTIVYVRVLTEIAVVAPEHWVRMSGPIGIMLGVSAILAVSLWFGERRGIAALPEQSNPTEIGSALAFGAIYAIVLVGAAAARHTFGDRGLYAIAAISGLTDMDAITLTVGRMAQEGLTGVGSAWRAIVIATMANLLFKFLVVLALGGRRLGMVVGAVFGATVLAAAAMLAWWPT
jgi:uncharacterized membrane protein (DUF4010 family)